MQTRLAAAVHTVRPHAVEMVHLSGQGRLRFIVAGLRCNARLEQSLRQFFSRRSGLDLQSISTLTGSVLLVSRSGLTPRTAEHLRLQVEAFLRSGGALARLSVVPAAAAWHELTVVQVAAELATSATAGLSPEEAQRRHAANGANTLPAAVRRPRLKRLLQQLWNLPSALLGASAGLSLLLRERVDAALIGGVMAANTAIGYTMESAAERVINSLEAAPVETVPVLRGGKTVWLAPALLVVGDVVVVRAGPVFADLRLTATAQLAVDESALTGESVPVNKTVSALPAAALAERSCMLFRGTVVVGGSGQGIVVATAGATEVGRIHALLGGVRAPATPLQRRLDDLGVTLVWLSAGICLGILGLGVARGLGAMRMLRSSISLAVAALPEGLPTVGTLTLALGIKRLKQRQMLVRQLGAVENLGAVNELCFDKTGTLTFNRLAVARLSIDLRSFLWQGDELITAEPGAPVDILEQPGLQLLVLVAVLCNDAYQDSSEGGNSGSGSSTEEALLGLAGLLGVTPAQLVADYPRLRSRYRSETTRYMATLHKRLDGTLLVAMKGSPEEVLACCSWYYRGGKLVRLTKATRARIQAINSEFAAQALRVLGLACKQTQAVAADGADVDLDRELIWLGLVGLQDLVRPGVKELLQAFHQAGIRTSLITGDQEATAQALCRQLGVEVRRDSQDAQLMVYARVNPADKLRIVQSLQQAGRVVAMTGDGVNDSPALRAADVGIAMGSGAAVAREAADVVLANNDLATLFAAVMHGRTIRDNLGKALHFLLATNLSEILVLLGSVAAGRPDGLTPRQLLWINLLTDVLPALALAVEPAEADTMTRPPRDPNGRLFSPSEWRRIVWEAVLLASGPLLMQTLVTRRPAAAADQAGPGSTVSFFALTVAQLLHTASSRSPTSCLTTASRPGNPWLRGGIGAGLLLQVATMATPWLRSLLGNAKLQPAEMAAASLGGLLPYVLIEATKALNLSWMHEASSL